MSVRLRCGNRTLALVERIQGVSGVPLGAKQPLLLCLSVREARGDRERQYRRGEKQHRAGPALGLCQRDARQLQQTSNTARHISASAVVLWQLPARTPRHYPRPPHRRCRLSCPSGPNAPRRSRAPRDAPRRRCARQSCATCSTAPGGAGRSAHADATRANLIVDRHRDRRAAQLEGLVLPRVRALLQRLIVLPCGAP